MDLQDVLVQYMPLWFMGAAMILATVGAGYKSLVRIQPKQVFKWSIFLLIIGIYRVIALWELHKHGMLPMDMFKGVLAIPWLLIPMAWWEDASHGLPLLLLRKLIGINKFTIPIHILVTLMVMISFGLGHTYQSMWAALAAAVYIPVSVKLGEKYGFGTVMVSHILYDMSTMIVVRYMLGAF